MLTVVFYQTEGSNAFVRGYFHQWIEPHLVLKWIFGAAAAAWCMWGLIKMKWRKMSPQCNSVTDWCVFNSLWMAMELCGTEVGLGDILILYWYHDLWLNIVEGLVSTWCFSLAEKQWQVAGERFIPALHKNPFPALFKNMWSAWLCFCDNVWTMSWH